MLNLWRAVLATVGRLHPSRVVVGCLRSWCLPTHTDIVTGIGARSVRCIGGCDVLLERRIILTPPLRTSGGARTSRSGPPCRRVFSQGANIRSATLVGSFSQAPLDCTTLSATDAPLNATVRWIHNGLGGESRGRRSSTTPPLVPSRAAVVTVDIPSTLAADSAYWCKGAPVTGIVRIGPLCGHVGDPIAIYPVGGRSVTLRLWTGGHRGRARWRGLSVREPA